MPDPSVAAGRNWNRFARVRDAKVLWLLGSHPMTAAHLVRVGLFPTAKKARRRLRRLAERHRVKLAGTVHRHPGRPEHVFCRWRPSPQTLRHEVELTDVCLRLHVGRIARGPGATDPHLLPDAELWVNGQRLLLEHDRGTTAVSRLARDRFAKYQACPDLSLWVCPTPARRDALRAAAQALRGTALFCTLPDLLADPHGSVWLDVTGGPAALPRERPAG